MPTQTLPFDAAAIDALLAPYDQAQLPGIAVGVQLGGRVVYRKGFGLARMELPVLLSPTIRMRIGSTSKHFAALAFMLLVEAGHASLDDEVRKHLPELSTVANGVTLRHLMGHTSGLRCSLELVLQLSGVGHFASTEDQFQLIAAQDAANFAPGERWSYCNGGYVLLTKVIERLTGQTLEDVLRTRIFEPLGMDDTLLRRIDTDFVPNSASLHNLKADGSFTSEVMGPAIAAEGGIVSTIDDMLLWLAHMDRPVVGSAASWAAMTTSLRLNSGYPTHYGLGLMVGEYRGTRVIHHAGGVFGGSCQMIKVPDHQLDIVVITNRGGVDVMGLADRIIDSVVPDLQPRADESPATLVDGSFYSAATGTNIRLYSHEGKQMISVGGADVPMRVASDGALEPTIPVFRVRVLSPPGAAKPDNITFVDMGAKEQLTRIEPDPAASIAEFLGGYRSDATGSSATLAVDGDVSKLTIDGRFGKARYRLDNVGPGLWRATSLQLPMPLLGGLIEPDPRGFSFTTGRTLRLRFERH